VMSVFRRSLTAASRRKSSWCDQGANMRSWRATRATGRFSTLRTFHPRLPGSSRCPSCDRDSAYLDWRSRNEPHQNPEFWLAHGARHWLCHDSVALILIFACRCLRSWFLTRSFRPSGHTGSVTVSTRTSRTLRGPGEYVAASRALKSSTFRYAVDGRAGHTPGKADSAIHIPPDFERDLKAQRRPQSSGSITSSPDGAALRLRD